jgi:hypothetical protein
MDTTQLDAVARLLGNPLNRRETLRKLVTGAAIFGGGSLLTGSETEARKKRRKHKKRNKNKDNGQLILPNPCEGKNWCVDRSQTCGPEGGYGKCLVEPSGNNICAEILFQVPSCTECEEPNCTNCTCVLAAGGGDRCNNGATGYDFICVRKV